MISRPAILNRLPDVRSLRGQIVVLAGLLASAFSVVFVLAANELDARRFSAVAESRVEALAGSLAPWLDGDSHAVLGDDPKKRLGDLCASLELVARSTGIEHGIRTLRAK